MDYADYAIDKTSLERTNEQIVKHGFSMSRAFNRVRQVFAIVGKKKRCKWLQDSILKPFIDDVNLFTLIELFELHTFKAGETIPPFDDPIVLVCEGTLALSEDLPEATRLPTTSLSVATGLEAARKVKIVAEKMRKSSIFGMNLNLKFHLVATDDVVLLILPLNKFKLISTKKTALIKTLHSLQKTDIVSKLSEISFLQDCSSENLGLLVQMSTLKSFAADVEVCTEGGASKSWHFILVGTLDVFWEKKESRQSDNIILSPGDHFGEMEMMLNMARQASVKTRSAVLTLTISKETFDNFLLLCPGTKRVESEIRKRMIEKLVQFNIPFFTGIRQEKLQAMSENCKILQLPADSSIIRQGEHGSRFYVLISGEVRVTVANSIDEVQLAKSTVSTSTADEQEEKEIDSTEVARYRDGDFFGELALFGDGKRQASVDSTKACVLLTFTFSQFKNFFAETPEAYAEVQIRALQNKCRLEHILAHPMARKNFEDYLEEESGIGNLKFWQAVQDFKSTLSQATSAEVHFTAEEIYQRFVVTENGGDAITLNEDVRETLTRKMQDTKMTGVRNHIFDEANTQIFLRMEEYFSRYITDSDQFAELMFKF